MSTGFAGWLLAQGFARRTAQIYANHVARFVDWCSEAGVDPRLAAVGDVAAHIEGRGETMARQIRCAVAQYWVWLGRDDEVSALAVLKRPRGERRPRPTWSALDETRELARRLEAKGHAAGTVVRYADLFQEAAMWCSVRGLDIATVTGEEVAAMAEAFPATRTTRTALRNALAHYWRLKRRRRPPVDAIRVPAAASPAARGQAVSAGKSRRRIISPLSNDEQAELQRYVSYLCAEGLTHRTALSYAGAVRRAIVWCSDNDTTLASIDGADVLALADGVPYTTSSRRQLRTALQHWWQWTGRDNPPVRAIKVPPKPRGVCRALDEDSATLLAKTARDWWPHGAAVQFGLYLALRREEIATVRWDGFNADMTAYTLTGKRSITSTLPVPEPLRDQLADRRPPGSSGYLFPGYQGRTHAHPYTVAGWITEVAEAAGIGPIQSHQLRHTAIATANDRTGDLRTVQAFARHANPEETARYTRASWSALERVSDAITY